MNINKKHNKLYQRISDEEKNYIKNLYYHEQRGREDPVYFAEQHLGLTLHKGQKEYLRFSDPLWIAVHQAEIEEFCQKNKRQIFTGHKNILNPCNRWGKTVIIAIKHIRYNYYKIGVDGKEYVWEQTRYQTLGISPHSAQIEAVYNYILDILNNRFPIIPYGEDGEINLKASRKANKCKIDFYVSDNSSKRRIQFKSNAAFYGTSTGDDKGASLAGRPFGYVSYDECVLSYHLHEELFGRIFSRTMDWNAPVDLISTADVDAPSQQYFYHLVRAADKGENEWYIQHGVLDDNLFLDKQTKEKAKQKLLEEDPLKYRQVVLGEFIPSSTKAFEIETIENIWTKDIPKPLRKDLPNPALANHNYVISVDWGFADSGDPSIFLVFNITDYPYKMVHHLEVQGGNPMVCLATLKIFWVHFNQSQIIMDTGSMGGEIIKKLLKDMQLKVNDFTGLKGEKGDAIFRLKLLLSDQRKPKLVDNKIVEDNPNYGGLRSYYVSRIEDELASYEIEDKRLKQDFVVCLYQFAWFMNKLKKREQGVKIFNFGKRNIISNTYVSYNNQRQSINQ